VGKPHRRFVKRRRQMGEIPILSTPIKPEDSSGVFFDNLVWMTSEEAARYLQSHNFENPQAETQQPIKPTHQYTKYEETAVGAQPIPLSTQPKLSQQSGAQQTQQQIPKKKTNAKKIFWITILTIILLVLIGGLISIFLFKDIIMGWFGK